LVWWQICKKTVDKEVEEAKKALNTAGKNDDWELFQLATKGFSQRKKAITKGRDKEQLNKEEKQAFASIEASMDDIEMMAISVAAVKHLRCDPASNEEGDKPTRPESYDLFRSGASMYIAAQIKQTSDQNKTIELISKESEVTQKDLDDPDKNINSQMELNQQLINMKVASMLMQHQVKAVDMRKAKKEEAVNLFKSAYEAALTENETKEKKIEEIDKKIDGAQGREDHNKSEESKFDLLSIAAFATAAICYANEHYTCGNIATILGILRELLRDEHKDKKEKAIAKKDEYEKEKKEYEKHGYLTCRAVGSVDVPKSVIGYNHLKGTMDGLNNIKYNRNWSHYIQDRMKFSWLKMRGHISINQGFNKTVLKKSLTFVSDLLIGKAHAGETQSQEQGLAMKGGTENYKYFVETKIFNKKASSDDVDCSGKSSKPRGQVQAFPFPCHRVEYLARVVEAAEKNVENLNGELATALNSRNKYASLTHETRVRLGIRPGAAQGGIDDEEEVQRKPIGISHKLSAISLENINTIGTGLNSIGTYSQGLNDSIKKKEDRLNKIMHKSGENKVNLAKRTTQNRINMRRRIVGNFLKSNKSSFLEDLLHIGGSYNESDVQIANNLNGGGSATTASKSNLALDKSETDDSAESETQDKLSKKEQLEKDQQLKRLENMRYTASKAAGKAHLKFNALASSKSATGNSSGSMKNVEFESKLTEYDKMDMVNALKNKKRFKSRDHDTLFTKISKTYFRKALPVLLDLR